MACNANIINSLLVKNFTGQSIKVTPISAASANGDSTGEAVYAADGSLLISKVGPTYVIPPQADPSRWTIIGDWWPAYNGYTTQTADGLYAMTGAMSTGSGVPGSMDNNNGCRNGTIILCAPNGCFNADGSATSSDYTHGSIPMSSSAKYYGKYDGSINTLLDGIGDTVVDTVDDAVTAVSSNKFVMVLILIFVVAIVAAVAYFFTHRNLN